MSNKERHAGLLMHSFATFLLVESSCEMVVFQTTCSGKRAAGAAANMMIWQREFLILKLLPLVLMFVPVISNLEGDALYTLRRNLVDPDNVLQSWDPTLVDPCTWFHVTCDKNNHVTRLELYRNRLVGKIPAELGKLKNLKSLDLYHNNFTGEIPPSLGDLKSLRFLRLNNNNLKGQIPWTLTSIASLKTVDLSNNDFCGVIPTFGSFSKFSAKGFQNNPRLKGPELVGSVLYDVDCI